MVENKFQSGLPRVESTPQNFSSDGTMLESLRLKMLEEITKPRIEGSPRTKEELLALKKSWLRKGLTNSSKDE